MYYEYNMVLKYVIYLLRYAQMAELVDALDSKSNYRKVVQVRFLFWAQLKFTILKQKAYINIVFFFAA